MPFIQRLGLSGLLSFPPGMKPFELRPLNVLVGPNGAGKSNVIDAIALLASTPVGVDRVIQAGGGAHEWMWKGEWRRDLRTAVLNAEVADHLALRPPLRYCLEFFRLSARIRIEEEIIEGTTPVPGHKTPYLYYRYNGGEPLLDAVDKTKPGGRTLQRIERGSIMHNQSILNQRQEPQLYPELTLLGWELQRITIFREWTFGTLSPLRAPQRADDPADRLLPDARNLALILNEIAHRDDRAFRKDLQRFLPQYERISTRILGGTVQLFLHEHGLNMPIPSTRISDGTLRFLAILAALHTPDPPPLLCLEEPELGMHPDAVGLLAELLIEASNRMQIVVTTHSDALLSGLGDRVDSVLVCENNGRGTSVDALDPERLSSWLDEYTLGDVWRAGQLGGNP